MAITKSFGGKSINNPGAYSRNKVDNSAGGAFESNDTIFLVGESTEGKPGSSDGIQEFTNAQLSTLIAKYGRGPIVDCALAASRPSKTPGIGGAGRYLVYKTNATLQATLDVNEATDSDRQYEIGDRQWGIKGNDLSVTIANGTTPATQKIVTINKLNDTAESLGQNDGFAGIAVQYTGDATTAVLVIDGLTFAAKTLATTLAGDQTDSSANLSIILKNYSLKELVDYINAQIGYTATLETSSYAAKKGHELDSVVSATIKAAAISYYRNQYEILEIINTSTRVEASLHTAPLVGLPVNITNAFLTGGVQGASINSDFSTGFSKSLAEEYNQSLACISRDASDDIADTVDGFTDAASSYTISAVLTAQDSHLRVRSDIEGRKEAQGFGGVRESAKADAYTEITALGSEFMQMAIQDCRIQDQDSNLTWKHPHVYAALCAGIRLGTEVGEPLTHKRLNANSVGHFVNSETGAEGGDFNVDLDRKVAINNGVLFSEKIGSIHRIVVDNTTYGTDDSFVFNRGSVMEASLYTAKDIRGVAEEVFIGKKLPANGAAKSIKEVIKNRLIELNAPDVNILSSSLDAPQGFVPETFVVEVEGNTASVQVEIKPVQGLDFIFITFTIGDISQAA